MDKREIKGIQPKSLVSLQQWQLVDPYQTIQDIISLLFFFLHGSPSLSVELVQALCIALDVAGEDARQFVQEVADNQHGISLAFAHHRDSLKSGNSYSNEQHIKLKDIVDVSLLILKYSMTL